MAMSDVEMLECAAKAVGMKAGESMYPNQQLAGGLIWDPLGNDADCAMLEAALEIDVHWGHCVLDSDEPCVVCGRLREAPTAAEPYGFDKRAARRRASVRVAAQIGGAAA